MKLYLELAPGQQMLVAHDVELFDLSGGRGNARGVLIRYVRQSIAAAQHALAERGVCLACGRTECGATLFAADARCCAACTHLSEGGNDGKDARAKEHPHGNLRVRSGAARRDEPVRSVRGMPRSAAS